ADPQEAATLLVPPEDTVDALPHSIRHGLLVKRIYYDDTDRNDYLVEETSCHLHGHDHSHAGNRFVIRDRASGETFLLLKDGPTLHATLERHCDEFFWQDQAACGIRGSGIDPEELTPKRSLQAYGAILGVGAEALRLLSSYLAITGPRTGLEPFTISNTWGDRNRDAALNESFVRSEIDAAAELGIDYVQLDDGWQRGVSKNSGLATGGVWEGYYAVDDQFWSVHESKFPNGLEPLVAYSRERGVRIGLWFSPDSTRSFENWRRDADVLLSFYRDLGIDQFKLDGIKIRDKRGEGNLLKLLTAVEDESDGSIDCCMDVTAEIRLGYIYGRRHGKIFVENRYTDWGNYFPCRTLRNLWMLARDMPARRFQIEVLNNRRNASVYGDDPLAPRAYGMDYLFAIAMPATPLLFMELSHLSEEARTELRPMLTLHRSIRDRLAQCSIAPIGELPDGHTFSGFQCAHPDGGGYLVLFRDLAPEPRHTFTLAHRIDSRRSLQLVHTAGSWSLQASNSGKVTVTAARKRSFAVVEY
ncbi:MAG: glycoside hydrolase family 97 catalytic domain-containing protein, partial [Spirochaetales bacterium]